MSPRNLFRRDSTEIIQPGDGGRTAPLLESVRGDVRFALLYFA